MVKMITVDPKTIITIWFICSYVKSACKWFNGVSNVIYGNTTCKTIIYKYVQNELGGRLLMYRHIVMGTSPSPTKNSLNFWFQLQRACLNLEMDF